MSMRLCRATMAPVCGSVRPAITGQMSSTPQVGFRRAGYGLRYSFHSIGHASNGLRRSMEMTRGGSLVVEAYRGGDPTVPDRVLAGLPYLLPLFDGLRYGKFLFIQFPIFGTILAPLNPLISLYFSVPFAGIISFFAVYLGIINNFNMARFVRFNAMQAVLLDIILILPGLLESVLKLHPSGGVGLQLYIQIYNAIFLFVLASVVYGLGSCMAGRTARLPIVADAADAQIR